MILDFYVVFVSKYEDGGEKGCLLCLFQGLESGRVDGERMNISNIININNIFNYFLK